MDIIKVGGREVVVGLTWRSIDNSESKTQLPLIRGEIGSRYEVLLRSSSGDLVGGGFAENSKEWGKEDSKRFVGKPSLSAWLCRSLADIGRDGIFIHRVDEDRYWYTYIRKGQVWPGTDQISDGKTVKREVADIMGLSDDGDKGVGLWGDGVKDLLPNAKVLSDELPGVSGKAPGQARLKAQGGSKMPLLLVLLVAVGGGFGYVLMPKTNHLQQLQQQHEQQVAQERFQAQQAMKQFVSGEQSTGASLWLKPFVSVFENMPTQVGNWVLVKAQCNTKQKACGFTWNPVSSYAYSPTKFRDYFVKAHPSYQVSFDMTKGQAVLMIPVKPLKPKVPPYVDSPATIDLFFDLRRLLSNYPVTSFQVSKAKPHKVAHQVLLPKGTPHYVTGSFSTSGDLASLKTMVRHFSRTPLSVDSLKFERSTDIAFTWKLEGTYVTY